MVVRASPALLTALLLVGCGDEPPAQSEAPRDPAVVQALDDPLMTDPDLSSRNEGAAAITVRTDGPLPILPVTAEDIAAARADAARMVGGEDKLAPVPPAVGQVPPLAPNASPSDHLAVLAGKTACKAKLSDSAIWAARLPAALPVYPRGATLAATGGDGRGCRVAAVRFSTPVPPAEVLAFYWQRAVAAGMAPVHLRVGERAVLQGQRTGEAFDLRVTAEGGLTTVDLATVTG